MKNEYEVRGDVTAIIINSPKYGRHETLVSTSKLDLVKEFTGSWYVNWNNSAKSFYVVGNALIVNGKRKSIFLHRWVTNAPCGMVVDHINHDTLDNTFPNLRIITNAQNMQNRKGARSNSKSGIRGVEWDEYKKKWRVRVRVNGSNKHIGYFDTTKEAEQVSVEARSKYMPFSKEALSS